jgi:hypothetical protein
MNKGGGKRAQVTMFIIVGVIIVAIAVLIFLFYPKIKASIGFGEKNPQELMQECLQDELKTTVDKVSSQGGSLNPEHYFLYNDTKIEYLCYQEEYYLTCVMQQPLLKEHIESEIKNAIQQKANDCLESLKTNFQNQGYEVSLTKKDVIVELLPEKVVVTLDSNIVLKKIDTQAYNKFTIVANNNLYELISIANSILNWEARYGDSETTMYMNYYHNLKVEKKLQSDGTTIYILTNRENENKFQFASRSVAWPPGYGTSEMLF